MKLLMTLLLVASTVFVSGCGKKDAPKKTTKNSKMLAKNSEVPLYDNSGLELFENDSESFAFVNGKDKSGKVAREDLTDADLQLSWSEQDSEKAFEPVLFTFNKYDIREDQKAVAAKDASLAKNITAEGHKIVVQGHADKFGSASYNLALSEKRAAAVRSEIAAKGVDTELIEIVGFGQEMPLVWSDAQDKETQIKDLQPNRRAEIVTVS